MARQRRPTYEYATIVVSKVHHLDLIVGADDALQIARARQHSFAVGWGWR